MAGTFAGQGKLEVAITSAPDDPAPVWVDITPYVRTETGALQVTRGRQSELDTVQSSQLTCTLDNTDGRFTPGYTAGPYGANWITGKKVRYSETLGQRTFVLFTGYLEFPDVDSWQPIGYQEVQLTALDRLTRLARGKPFVSTLGAHILGSPPAANLAGYWTLADAPTWAPTVGAGPNAAPVAPLVAGAFIDWTGTLVANTAGTPGDDIGSTSFALVNFPALGLSGSSLGMPFAGTVAAGQSLSVCCWIQAKASGNTSGGPVSVLSLVADGGTSRLKLFDTWTGAGQPISAQFNLTTLTCARPYPLDCWRLVTLVYTPSTGACSIWCGPDDIVAGAATPVGTLTFSGSFALGDTAFAKNMAHLQIYVGTPLTFADHLAQWQVGMYGLERQTAGARANSILDYAGVSAGERAIDPGVSLVQRATLAGQSPADALATAVSTERGRGFISGDGRFVLHDRVRVLNV